MPFRFVHTADVHLDSPLRSLALRNEDLAELIGNATRQAFSATIDLCIDEAVDALMIVGDLFDGRRTSMKTAVFFASEMRRLDEAGIRTFITRGNHDALMRTFKEGDLPESVKVFGGRPQVVPIGGVEGGPEIAVHGISFTDQTVTDNVVGRFKPPVDGAVNIGLLHTSLGGATGHDTYAPCSVADLEGCGFDYWGLGHIHKRGVFSEKPMIIMPGTPQGRNINEAGAKSVTLVTIDDDRSISSKEYRTGIAEFARVAVDLSGVDDWRDMLSAVRAALEKQHRRTPSGTLIVRLSVTGSTALAWRLRQDIELLKTEADDLVGSVWVEKVEIDCRPATTESGPETANPVIELGNLIANEIANSEGYLAAAREVVEDIRLQLPPESRHLLGDDEEAFDEFVNRLVAEGSEDVLARLHGHALDDGAE